MSGKAWSRYDRSAAGFGVAGDTDQAFGRTGQDTRRGPLVLLVGIGVFLLFFAVVWKAYPRSGGVRDTGAEGSPVIYAEEGPLREAAASAPVVRSTNSDLEVFEGTFNAGDGVPRAETATIANAANANTGIGSVDVASPAAEPNATSGSNALNGSNAQSRTDAGVRNGSPSSDLTSRGTSAASAPTTSSAPGDATGAAPGAAPGAATGSADGPSALQARLDAIRAASAPATQPSPQPTLQPTRQPAMRPASSAASTTSPDIVTQSPPGERYASVLPSVTYEGVYAVQIASFRSRPQAEDEWIRLRGLYPELLGVRDPEIVFADLGGPGVRYRVRMPGFEDRGGALGFCDALKTLGQECLVVRR